MDIYFETLVRPYGPEGDVLVTLRYEPGWLLRLVGRKTYRRTWRGGWSVWRDAATGEAPDRTTADFLTTLYTLKTTYHS